MIIFTFKHQNEKDREVTADQFFRALVGSPGFESGEFFLGEDPVTNDVFVTIGEHGENDVRYTVSFDGGKIV